MTIIFIFISILVGLFVGIKWANWANLKMIENALPHIKGVSRKR